MAYTTVHEKQLRSEVGQLLSTLPVESLLDVHTYITKLNQESGTNKITTNEKRTLAKKRFSYPTIIVSASVLEPLLTNPLTGYEGDALADTEALYDSD